MPTVLFTVSFDSQLWRIESKSRTPTSVDDDAFKCVILGRIMLAVDYRKVRRLRWRAAWWTRIAAGLPLYQLPVQAPHVGHVARAWAIVRLEWERHDDVLPADGVEVDDQRVAAARLLGAGHGDVADVVVGRATDLDFYVGLLQSVV